MPEDATIRYKGDVFDHTGSSGRFYYYVDFKNNATEGYGSFSTPDKKQKYILADAPLTDKNKFHSEVLPAKLDQNNEITDIDEDTIWGDYTMQLFGENAEEIAGFAYNYDKTEFYGFSGTGTQAKKENMPSQP